MSMLLAREEIALREPFFFLRLQEKGKKRFTIFQGEFSIFP
jgi:hypothetical protein